MSSIHASAVVANGAIIAATAVVGPFCVIGPKVRIGENVVLKSHVSIEGDTAVGARTVVYPFASLGGAPQYRGDNAAMGTLTVGTDNVIREHVSFHVGSARGRGATIVGNHGYFMAYSHVAHDCRIGDNVTFANAAQVGGHAEIGDGATISTLSGVHQFGRVGRGAFVGAMTGATTDVVPYGMAVGGRARLRGLNLIGLKRKGLSRARIHDMRSAYRAIFLDGDGSLAERAAAARKRWPESPEIGEIVDFILADAKRFICTPDRDGRTDVDDDG